MNNPINIIGAGAVGKALAVLLQKEGKEVSLIRGRATGKAVSKHQLTVQLLNGSEIKQDLAITTLAQYTKLEGIVVIATKSFGNAALAPALRKKTTGPVVLLQNGLGIEQPFIEQSFESLLRGILFLTSQVGEENNIGFRHVRPSPIGVVLGSTKQLREVVSSLTTAHFPFCEERNIQPVIWKKAIINCVFNSICPLLETDNGIFHREKEVLEIGKEVVREGIAVAHWKGVTLKEDDIVAQLLQISETSDGRLISTLQDMMAGRPTEIETLNLAVANMGRELGMDNMAQRNELLGKLIRWKSKLHR